MVDDLIDINMLLDDIGEEETTYGGNLEIGELLDMEVPFHTDTTTQTNPTDNTTTQTPTQNTTNTDGSTPQVDQAQSSQSHRNAFGRAPRPKKICCTY